MENHKDVRYSQSSTGRAIRLASPSFDFQMRRPLIDIYSKTSTLKRKEAIGYSAKVAENKVQHL